MVNPKCEKEDHDENPEEKSKFHIKIRILPLTVSGALMFAAVRCLPATFLGELLTKRELFNFAQNGTGGLLCSILVFAALLQFVIMFVCGLLALLASVFDGGMISATLMGAAGLVATICAILYVVCLAVANYAWSGGIWLIRPNQCGFILTGLGAYLWWLGWDLVQKKKHNVD